MSGVNADDLEAEALWVLEQLVARYGAALVRDVFLIVTTGGPGMLIEDLSNFVASLVRDVLSIVSEDTARAAIEAGFAAANAAGDAAIAAKFPKGTP